MHAHEAYTQTLERYGLSLRKLEKLCAANKVNLSYSTLQRLLSGKAADSVREQLQPQLADVLRAFLTNERGLLSSEIEAALALLFNTNGGNKPMIARTVKLTPEAILHFGLKFDPFTTQPRAETEVYTNNHLNLIFEKLKDAVNYQGFTVVLGEVGCGKSLLRKRLMEHVIKSNGRLIVVWPEFFQMRRVRAGSISRALLEHFGQRVPNDLVSQATKLKRILKEMSDDGKRVAIGLDECHRLSDDTVSSLKNFWEMGSGGFTQYLGVILFGQPQFEDRLIDTDFREIAERIEIIQMPRLDSAKLAADYIAYRVKIAGGEFDKLFDRAAIDELGKQAKTPLALGNLANAALEETFARGEAKVLARFVKGANTSPALVAVREATA